MRDQSWPAAQSRKRRQPISGKRRRRLSMSTLILIALHLAVAAT
jgi:hypothetical protein